MSKRKWRVIGLLLLAAAFLFVVYAFTHPELTFPWSNRVSYTLYGLYTLVMVVCLIGPSSQ